MRAWMAQATHRNLKILYFGNFVMRLAFGIVILALPRYIGHPEGELSGLLQVAIIAAPYPAMEMITANYFGVQSDRIGRRKVIVAGSVLAAAMVALYPLWDNVWYLAGVHAIHGVGAAATVAPAVAMIADYAHRSDRGRQMGAYDYSTFAGYIVGIVAAGLLLELPGLTTYQQNAATFWAATGCLAVSAVLLQVYLPDEAILSDEELTERRKKSHWQEFKEGLREPAIRKIIPIWMTVSILMGFAITYGPRIMLEGGETPLQISLMFAAGGLVLFLLQPLWGWVSDRVGRLPVMAYGLASIAGISVILLFFLDRVLALDPLLLVPTAVFGLGAGAFIPSALAYMADSASTQHYGRTMGLYSFVIGFGFFIAESVGLVIIAGLPQDQALQALVWASAGLVGVAIAMLVGFFVLDEGIDRLLPEPD